MHRPTKLFMAALTAAVVLASAVGTASANRLSISNKTFRMTWSPVSFNSGAEGEGIHIACNTTLEGSFHYNTLVKVRGALVGYITKAVTGHPCSGSGEAWDHNGIENPGLGSVISSSLPWHISYEGFEGTLPSITGTRNLITVLFTFRTLLTGLCAYFGNIEGVNRLNRSGAATAIVPDPNAGIPRSSGGGFCPERGFFTASAERATVTLLGSTTLITVTLI